jgi:hypothetical protein
MFDALLPSRHNGRRRAPPEPTADAERAAPAVAPNGDRHVGDLVLEAVRVLVEERLPWTSQRDGRPVQMDVVAVGYLDRHYRHFVAGTPFATVGVANWEAAAAVREALAPIARLSEAAWEVGWRGDGGVFRCIRVFPALS